MLVSDTESIVVFKPISLSVDIISTESFDTLKRQLDKIELIFFILITESAILTALRS